MNPYVLLFGLTAVWLLALSLVFYKLLIHYRQLSKGVKGANLEELLDKVLSVEEKNRLDIKTLERGISKINEDSFFYIKKFGIVRFNPFREMGGDQSFSLALINGNTDGMVITGLHTRERTRVYIKEINKGKSSLELSDEERKALAKALKS